MSASNSPLQGKVAIVTGSGRGMGAAILLRLATLGADVVVNYANSVTAAEAVAAQARDLGVKAITVKADVSKRGEITNLFEEAKKAFGRIDIVMSNSGIEHFGDLPGVTEEELDRVFAVNVKGQFFIAQEAYKHMENNGHLILMSSVSAVQGFRRHSVYSASKAAIIGMIKCLAWDFGPRGITVNCLAPGGVKTEMFEESTRNYIPGGDKLTNAEVEARVGSLSPMGRPGFPKDVADVVGFVATPESQWLTGQTFHISGGFHMN